MILESITTDAIQKYGREKVNAIIQRDNALCGKDILPICSFCLTIVSWLIYDWVTAEFLSRTVLASESRPYSIEMLYG